MVVLKAVDFGLKADGKSDDGPAIQKMLAKARTLKERATLAFPKNKVVYVKTGDERYVFRLKGQRELIIDGGGCEFRLDKELRFMDMLECSKVMVKNLKVDFDRPNSLPGIVVAVGDDHIDVKLHNPKHALLSGAPTKKGGEQAWFAILRVDTLYGMNTHLHYFIKSVEKVSNDVVRIYNDPKYRVNKKDVAGIKIGETPISLPECGIAHRAAPGAVFEINDNNGVVLKNIEVWSAPWFVCRIIRNEGKVIVRKFNIRPKPGSKKYSSSWRDGMHCKGNRAQLLFEDCILTGMNDDAFNIASFNSFVRKVHSDSHLVLKQQYPIQYVPMREGDELFVIDPKTNKVMGTSVITSIKEIWPKKMKPNRVNSRPAPSVELKLKTPVNGLLEAFEDIKAQPKAEQRPLVAWDRQTSNPLSVIKNCTIRMSSRFQGSNIRLEKCDIEAYSVFYGLEPEGPGPERVKIIDSVLKFAKISSETLDLPVHIPGWERSGRKITWDADESNTYLKEVILENNEIWGSARINKSLSTKVTNNTFFSEKSKPLIISNPEFATTSGNTFKKPKK